MLENLFSAILILVLFIFFVTFLVQDTHISILQLGTYLFSLGCLQLELAEKYQSLASLKVKNIDQRGILLSIRKLKSSHVFRLDSYILANI
jgi:hypothetical protein